MYASDCCKALSITGNQFSSARMSPGRDATNVVTPSCAVSSASARTRAKALFAPACEMKMCITYWLPNVEVTGAARLYCAARGGPQGVRPAWARTYGVKAPCGRTELDS